MASKRGFSLIEIVVSIGIIASVVTVYAISSQITQLSRHVRYDDVALRIATSKLEALRATSYASLPASGAFADPLLSSFASSTAYAEIADYNADTKRITVTVSYQELGKTARTVSLTTLVTRVGGLQ